jgi:hypothetical protein
MFQIFSDCVTFVNNNDNNNNYHHLINTTGTAVNIVRRGIIVSEILVNIIKKSSDAHVQTVLKLVPLCISMAKARLEKEESSNLDGVVDLRTMKLTNNDNNNSNSNNNNQIESTMDTNNNNKSNNKINTSAACTADLVLFRQSCISLLCECVVKAGWSGEKFCRDVLDIGYGILNFETVYNQASRACRRYYCSFYVFNHILLILFIIFDNLKKYLDYN